MARRQRSAASGSRALKVWTVFERRDSFAVGKARTGNQKIEQVNSFVWKRPSNLHAAEASAPHAAQKKVNDQTRRLPELFDNDMEHPSELDISQTGKDLQREYHLTLSERSSTPLQPDVPGEAKQGSHHEFIAFFKHVKTNPPSRGKQAALKHQGIHGRVHGGHARLARPTRFLDRTLFTIGTFPCHTPL